MKKEKEFNPDEYLAEDFNPDEYLAENTDKPHTRIMDMPHIPLSPEQQNDLPETIGDVAVSAANASLFDYGDELVASIMSAHPEITYEQAHKITQDFVNRSRERSPVATTVGDILAPNPAKFVKSAGLVAKTLANPWVEGALTGSGAAGEGDSLMGAGFGLAGTAAGKMIGAGAEKIFGEPEKKLASALDIDPTNIKKSISSRLDPEEEVKRNLISLMDTGITRGTGEVKYDIALDKFIPVEKGKLANVGTPSAKLIKTRLQQANDSLLEEVKRVVRRDSPDVSNHTDFMFENIDESYFDTSKITPRKVSKVRTEQYPISPSTQYGKNAWDVSEVSAEILDDVERLKNKLGYLTDYDDTYLNKLYSDEIAALGRLSPVITPVEILKRKQDIYKKIETYYTENTASSSDTIPREFLAGMARAYDSFLDNVSPDIKALNEKFTRNLKLGISLNTKEARKAAAGKDNKNFLGGLFSMVGEGIDRNVLEPTRISRANLARGYQTLPPDIKGVGDYMGERIKNNMFSPMSRELITPETVNHSRDPQSVGLDRMMKMRLPRSTEQIMQYPNVLITKVAMLAPQHLDTLQAAIEMDDQEALSAILPAIAEEVPTLFERDKYNRFDGVIPKGLRLNASMDVENDPNLSPQEKAKLRSKINSQGRID